jgi:S1-C subfamily serine protease
MVDRPWRLLVVLGVAALTSAILPRGRAQTTPTDLRAVHELAVYSTVRITTATALGSGWLLSQDGRPLVVTNRHVSETALRGNVEVTFYQGSSAAPASGRAHRFYESDAIDLAIFQLDEDPPASARALEMERGDVARGERIVLAGNPGELSFQTTEGVVTGALPATEWTSNCGRGRNCIVVDAASFAGSSGGPALNANGHVVGMLWGGPISTLMVAGARVPAFIENPAFAYLVHIRTIEDELRAWVERSRESRREREAGPER